MSANIAQLRSYDEQLFRLGVLAERYFPDDPNTALIKLRQLGERLAQQVASRFGAFTNAQESQLALIRRLEFDGLIEREVAALFHDLRTTGNDATHGLYGDHSSALSTLKIAWQLGVWFHRTFSDPEFRSGPFRPPQPPADESEELRAELAGLQRALDAFRAQGGAVAEQLSATEAQLQQALGEQQQWEQLAEASEADKVALAAQRGRGVQAGAATTNCQTATQATAIEREPCSPVPLAHRRGTLRFHQPASAVADHGGQPLDRDHPWLG